MQGREETLMRVSRWVRRAKRALLEHAQLNKELECCNPVLLDEVDAAKLDNLSKRRNTYGDICQGFSDAEISETLAKAGNDVPTAILLFKQIRAATGAVYVPPSFLDDSKDVHHTVSFKMGVHGRRTEWG